MIDRLWHYFLSLDPSHAQGFVYLSITALLIVAFILSLLRRLGQLFSFILRSIRTNNTLLVRLRLSYLNGQLYFIDKWNTYPTSTKISTVLYPIILNVLFVVFMTTFATLMYSVHLSLVIADDIMGIDGIIDKILQLIEKLAQMPATPPSLLPARHGAEVEQPYIVLGFFAYSAFALYLRAHTLLSLIRHAEDPSFRPALIRRINPLRSRLGQTQLPD